MTSQDFSNYNLQQQPERIYTKEHILVEEDEIAQINEIFKAFDTGNRGRINTDQLPTILRLLGKNIREQESLELQYELDKKNRGYFTLPDLIQFLCDFQFHQDTEQELMSALQELDNIGDGFIPKERFSQFLTEMGESFTSEEVNDFMRYALEDGQTDDLIDIKRLCKIILPKIQARNQLLQENFSIPLTQKKMSINNEITQIVDPAKDKSLIIFRHTHGKSGGFFNRTMTFEEINFHQTDRAKDHSLVDLDYSSQKDENTISNKSNKKPKIRSLKFKDFHQKGMASEIYNSEILLKKKQLLIQKIGETYENMENAENEKDVLNNMFITIREQRTYDNAKVNEIRPYFDFQNKIHLILDRIKQTNELRVKVQDTKIKQCKSDVKDKKKGMTVNLKEKVQELLEEELENKTHKIKMVAGRKLETQQTKAINDHAKKSSRGEATFTLVKHKFVNIKPENYHKYKIISEQIDLCHLFEKYLLVRELMNDNEENYDNNFDVINLKNNMLQIVESIDKDKKESQYFQTVGFKTIQGSLLGKRQTLSKGIPFLRNSSKSPPKLEKVNSSQNKDSLSRNVIVLSSQSSTGFKKSGASQGHYTITEADLENMIFNLTAKLSDQLFEVNLRKQSQSPSGEKFQILKVDMLIDMYEQTQIEKSLLLKNHAEFNQMRLDKELQLALVKQELEKYQNFSKEEVQRQLQPVRVKTFNEASFTQSLHHSNSKVSSYIAQPNGGALSKTPDSQQCSFVQQTSILSQSNPINSSINVSKEKDLWEIYQRQQEILIYKQELQRVKSHLERIKWCLNEQTNVYAYKVSIIRDVSGIKTDEKVEKILIRYKAIWPYLPLQYYKDLQPTDPQKISNIFKRKFGSMSCGSDEISRLNLELLKSSPIPPKTRGLKNKNQQEEQNPHQLSSRRLKILIQEDELMNEAMSKPLEKFKQNFQKVLQQKIEVPLLFSNILDFIKFLARQVDPNFKITFKSRQNSITGNLHSYDANMSLGQLLKNIKESQNDSLLKPIAASDNIQPQIPIIQEIGQDFNFQKIRSLADLSDVSQKDFSEKYMKFLTINDQNMAQLIRKEKEDQKENQQSIQNAQDQALEDKHIGETHGLSKVEMGKRFKGKTKDKKIKRNHILYNKKQRSNSVTNQVNYDKCMYSKLITFERQESVFVQKFLKQFDEAKEKLNQNEPNVMQQVEQSQIPPQNKINQKVTFQSMKTEKPPLSTKPSRLMTQISYNLKTNFKLSTSLKNSPQTKSDKKIKKDQKASSLFQKPPRLLLQNISLDQINSKETLSQIKSLIQKTSASTLRSMLSTQGRDRINETKDTSQKYYSQMNMTQDQFNSNRQNLVNKGNSILVQSLSDSTKIDLKFGNSNMKNQSVGKISLVSTGGNSPSSSKNKQSFNIKPPTPQNQLSRKNSTSGNNLNNNQLQIMNRSAMNFTTKSNFNL